MSVTTPTMAGNVLVISPDGRDGSTTISQDADLYLVWLQPGQTVTHDLKPGDGAGTEELGRLTVKGSEPTQEILFT